MVFPTKQELQGAWSKLLETLGFVEKAKNKEMTPEDWVAFGAAFEKEHGISLQAAFDETKGEAAAELTDEQKQEILGAVQNACAGAGVQTPTIDLSNAGTVIAGMLNVMAQMSKNMQEMGRRQEDGNPVAIVGAKQDPSVMMKVLGVSPHTATHLYGIESDHYKRGNWWNDFVATGVGLNTYKEKDVRAFEKAFNAYVDDFAERCQELVDNNQLGLLDYEKIITGESLIDYSNMQSKFGEYTVRRFDAIIAYFRTLASVGHIFPVVSNVQNEMTAPTSYFGELSQSFLSGHHYKGAVHFDGEKYHVDDLMMKFAFVDGKDLEKQFIGYKNREGSNPMKWHIFDWMITFFGKTLFNEQQRRRVIGVWTPRQGTVPQPAMTSGDGALRAIQRVEEELKVLPFKDLGVYTKATILEYVRTIWEKVSEILPNMNGMRLFMNEKHRLWYIDAYDAKYKNNNDYSGPGSDIRYYSPKDIIWVPNMELNDYKVWITTEGNIENYEDKQNEMLAFYFQQDLEILVMASWWKEGSGVLAPGVQYPTPADLENGERKLQFLFTNYPVIELEKDTDVIDAKLGREYQTGANTKATNIASVKNLGSDKVIKVICGSLDNKTTIRKDGAFSEIQSDWIPAKVGDWIKFYPQLHEVTKTIGKKQYKVVEPTGKLLELERKAY
jgi:hypothetical protein